MVRLILALLLVLVASLNAGAQPASGVPPALAEKVDKVFAPFDRPDSPGCALGVIREGQLVYTHGYGMADLEHDISISPSSVFYIGSTSKQFTAFSIALLARQGKLSLDDDIRKYLPELPDYGAPITVRHLIHHTSGLRDYWTLVDLAGDRTDNVYDLRDILELAARQKRLNFSPGEDYLYSNTGYTLLAAIAERAAGKPLREFADENIFRPLGMKHTRFNDDHTSILKNRALGYSPRRGEGFSLNIVNNDLVGAGGLWTTVEDFLYWDQNFSSGRVGGHDLLALAETPGTLRGGEKLTYAFGQSVGTHKGLKMIGHAGSFAGYRADYIRFPEQQLSVVVLCNLSTANPSTRAREVADILLADQIRQAAEGSGTNAAEPAGILLTEPELRSKAGIYLDRASGDFLRLELREGRLVLGLGQPAPLVPLEKNRFRAARGTAFELIFESLQGNRPARVRQVAPNARMQAFEAVPAASPTAAELAAYAGAYYSEELDATYKIVLEEGNLRVKRKRGPDVVLAPLFVDGFASESGPSLIFERDAKRRVTGFELNAGRVRHLRFVRQGR